VYDKELINSDVCISCGACCSTYVDSQTGEPLSLHEAKLSDTAELIHCPNLDTSEGLFRCKIYQERPATCREWDCLERGNRLSLEYPKDSVLGSRIRVAVEKIHGKGILIQLVD